MFARVKSFFRDELGGSLVEYALMLSLVALVAVFGLRVLGTSTNTSITDSTTSITAAIGTTDTANSTGGSDRNGHTGDGRGNGNGPRRNGG